MTEKAPCRGLFAVLQAIRLFCPKTPVPIDAMCFSCYNALTETIKEASSMGETPRKPNISVGLMAHV
jgi:hypothetical protein